MYITNTNNDVRSIIENLENKKDIEKLKFLIYVFGLCNNNQINDKNEINPNLIEDNDINIFNLESIGLTANSCTILLQYFVMLYNVITNTNDAYEDNGNVIGIKYNKDDNELNSQFERLQYNDKLDVFSEIIIRYDNETLFRKKFTILTFNSKLSGFDLANIIQNLKK